MSAPARWGSATGSRRARRLAIVILLLLGLGAGAGIAVNRSSASERPRSPLATLPPARLDDAPPGPPREVRLEPLAISGAPPGSVRISWRPPAGAPADLHYEMRWDVTDPDLARFSEVRVIRGRTSLVRERPPPGAGTACAILTPIREDGVIGAGARVCTG